jgi:glycosyltransferase involved in cell wall biosynthesis
VSSERLSPVAIIVPALNSERTLGRCLQAVKKAARSVRGSEILVVDNGSTDATAQIADRAGIRCVRESARGRSRARNTGIRATHSRLVAFVDADCLVAPDWLSKIIEPFGTEGMGGAQGPIVPWPKDARSPSRLDRLRLHLNEQSYFRTYNLLENAGRIPMINSAACVYSRSALEAAKGFDPAFARGEDVDLARRVSMLGFTLCVAPEARARVLWGGRGWLDYLASKAEAGYFAGIYLREWAADGCAPPVLLRAQARRALVNWTRTGDANHLLGLSCMGAGAAGRWLARLAPGHHGPVAPVYALQRRWNGKGPKMRLGPLPTPPQWRFTILTAETVILDLLSGRSLVLSDSNHGLASWMLRNWERCGRGNGWLGRFASESGIPAKAAAAQLEALEAALAMLSSA